MSVFPHNFTEHVGNDVQGGGEDSPTVWERELGYHGARMEVLEAF